MRSGIVCCLAVLFACAAFAQGPAQEYPVPVEVERITPTHQQQAAAPPAPGESFPEGVSGSEDWSHGRTAETCLAKSLFTDESENGWAVVGRSGLGGKPPGYIELQRTERSIEASDEEGADEWYFDGAGAGFLGNLSGAYNGQFRFKFSTRNQTVPDKLNTPPLIAGQAADIVIDTACGFHVWLDGVLSVSMQPRRYAVVVHEQAEAWIDSRTRQRITPVAFMEALSNVASIRIRGGLLRGRETARLFEVRLVPPSPSHHGALDTRPCCTPLGDIDACPSKSEVRLPGVHRYSEQLTPTGLAELGYVCGTSDRVSADRPRVKALYPRYSRRSGGTKVTVWGENFGLNGQKGILRIGGIEAKGCERIVGEHCTNGVLDYDEQGVDCGGADCAPCLYSKRHCSNGVVDDDEDQLDCGGFDCELCRFQRLADHCYNGVLDGGEFFVDQGGPDCLPIYCFEASLPGDKTDRLNNCGGSCAPCVNQTYASYGGAPLMAICDTPALETTQRGDGLPSSEGESVAGSGGVDFTWVREDFETGIPRWGCHQDGVVARGFEVGEVGFSWSVHWAALDHLRANDVIVKDVGIDPLTGDIYVAATTNKTTQLSGVNGTMGLFASHFDKGGFYEAGLGGVGSADETVLEQEGEARTVGQLWYVYGTLTRLTKEGVLVWITTLDSYGGMEVTSLVVDHGALPLKVWVAGAYRGGPPRYYIPDSETKKTRRGPAFGEGEVCDPEVDGWSPLNLTGNRSCWYVVGEAMREGDPRSGNQIQANKWGVFIVAYDSSGYPISRTDGSIGSDSLSSLMDWGSVRLVAHSTLTSSSTVLERNGSTTTQGTAFASDAGGLYLAIKYSVSKFGDVLYFGRQAVGSRGEGMCVNGEMVTGADGNATCVGGVEVETDLLQVKFEQILPTPDLNPTYVALVKLLVGVDNSIGSVWVRMIGDIGAGLSGSLRGMVTDGDGIYLTGANTFALRPFSFQNCSFGIVPPECEEGGTHYTPEHLRIPAGKSSCTVQRNIRYAPNQVCSDSYETTLSRHIFSINIEDGNETKPVKDMSQMWVVAYGGDGALRWVRQAKFGNLTSTAITVASNDAEGRGVGTGGGRAVYVAGEIIRVSYFIDEVLPPVEVEVPSEFGKMTEPLECSQSTPGEIGEFSVGGGLEGRPCGGVITARGAGSDVWLAKYDAVSGAPMWLKRFGGSDTSEVVTDLSFDHKSQSIYLLGAFSAQTLGRQDIFGLVAAGRGQALGCNAGDRPPWVTETARWGWDLVDGEQLGMPDCTVEPLSEGGLTAVLFKVKDGVGSTRQHGAVSKPWSQCTDAQDAACNTDGLAWARTLSSRGSFTTSSNAILPYSKGEVLAIAGGWMVVAGRFSGIRKEVTGSQYGLTTPGVDDTGFSNFDNRNTESFVTHLSD